jgi:hypothetical protein
LDAPKPPSSRIIWILTIILAGGGWIGLFLIINFTLPYLLPRWLFFFFLCMALTGTALPVTSFFNRRFPTNPPAGGMVILRQALWFGVYGTLLAWLQMGRILQSTMALFIAAGFVVIEVLIRISEVSRWKPKGTPDE